eukprot:TRINITY_DN574_c0_g1_i6.p1 TRINITY_DN574_c0_g1~~TRINITY_DN574_c0_g1_i6.p1  ORF type:complete len:118 (+),score=8.89 TRINITY_DN574_c0_g1_i6:29-355(+)
MYKPATIAVQLEALVASTIGLPVPHKIMCKASLENSRLVFNPTTVHSANTGNNDLTTTSSKKLDETNNTTTVTRTTTNRVRCIRSYLIFFLETPVLCVDTTASHRSQR